MQDTSRKIRAVQRAKGERRERVSSAMPYRYMRNPENKRELIPMRTGYAVGFRRNGMM